MGTEAASANSSRRLGGALLGVLLLALALNLVGVSWGLPTPHDATWAYDELSPRDHPFRAKSHHQGRYPPFHYWLLGVTYLPLELLEEIGAVDLSQEHGQYLLRLVGRSVSVVMSVVCLWLLYRLALLALGRREPAVMATGLMVLSPTWVYYSKLMNLEVPYCLWFLAAAIFSLRILERHRMRDYLGFGFMALFAITTKDQAFALFVLPALAFPFFLARHEKGRADLRGVGRSLLDRRLLLPAGLGILGFATIHNFAFDWNGFLHHIWMMLGPETRRFTEHPPTVMGHLAMAWQAVGHVRFVLGSAAAVASVAGIWLLARERRYEALWLLLFPVSYYLFFITPIGYHYDRFFVPVAAVLAIFAGDALWRLVSTAGPLLAARRLVVATALAIGLMRVVVLDAAMVSDSRYEVERWSAGREAAGATVVSFFGQRQRVPRVSRFIRWKPLKRHGVMALVGAGSPDYLIFNPIESLWEGTYQLLPVLMDGSYGYEEEPTFSPTWDFRRLIPPGVGSNLATISPEITVVRRTVELFFDGRKTVDELWSGLRSDWQEVGEDFLRAPAAPGRIWLDKRTAAWNVHPDRWTMGAGKALLARRNTSPRTVPSELVVVAGRRPRPTRARVVAPGLDLEIELDPDERRMIGLPAVRPGEVAVVAVGADDSWRRSSERELGVRVRLITGR